MLLICQLKVSICNERPVEPGSDNHSMFLLRVQTLVHIASSQSSVQWPSRPNLRYIINLTYIPAFQLSFYFLDISQAPLPHFTDKSTITKKLIILYVYNDIFRKLFYIIKTTIMFLYFSSFFFRKYRKKAKLNVNRIIKVNGVKHDIIIKWKPPPKKKDKR